jgi:ATP-dependent RNA helicase DDX18/HAS1
MSTGAAVTKTMNQSSLSRHRWLSRGGGWTTNPTTTALLAVTMLVVLSSSSLYSTTVQAFSMTGFVVRLSPGELISGGGANHHDGRQRPRRSFFPTTATFSGMAASSSTSSRLLYNKNSSYASSSSSYRKTNAEQQQRRKKEERKEERRSPPRIVVNDYDDDDDFDDFNRSFSPPPAAGAPLIPVVDPASPTSTSSSHFYSRKSLTDPSFGSSLDDDADNDDASSFAALCRMAGLERPSKIQALAWPMMMLRSTTKTTSSTTTTKTNHHPHIIIADQTGSGKTYAYLLPLLQRLRQQKSKQKQSLSPPSTRTTSTASPRLLILAPTSELADQIAGVIETSFHRLFSTTVLTGGGGKYTNIRDQIRLLERARYNDIDVLVTTPGRMATILRTRQCNTKIINLSRLQAVVFDEVDILLLDPTFGPQLETIGAAVNDHRRRPEESTATTTTTASTTTPSTNEEVQFVFCTATLPDRVVDTIRAQFPSVQLCTGPGLHKIAPTVTDTLIDVSVGMSSSSNGNNNRNSHNNNNGDLARDGTKLKLDAVFNALRLNRCRRTLIFGNTVPSCRAVVNALERHDRGHNLYVVDAYHNALTGPSRQSALRTFMEAADLTKSYILVATDRAARGVELGVVDHVILYDFANGPAEYMRRVGRTARAGRTGAVTILAYGWQLPIARQLLTSMRKGQPQG